MKPVLRGAFWPPGNGFSMKIFSRVAVPVFFFLGATVLTGCAKPSVVGKWNGSTPAPGGNAVQIAIEFKPDGSQTQTFSAMGQTLGSMQSTYSVADDKITETMTGASRNGQTVKLPGRTTTFSYKLDGDSLTLTDPNIPQPIVLTRAK